VQLIDLVTNLAAQASASSPVRIISPYITLRALKTVCMSLPPGAGLEVVTTFDYDLFATGSSSLNALNFLAKQTNARSYSVDSLHAKAYICGTRALIGSANLTDRGLGLVHKSNIEILVPYESSNITISRLLESIDLLKKPVSSEDISLMRFRLAAERSRDKEILTRRMDLALSKDGWLPACSLKYLMQYLRDGSLYRVPSISRASILDDARHLGVVSGLRLEAVSTSQLIARIAEIPIIQLSIESRLRSDSRLPRLLKSRGCGSDQIDALDNWSEFCIMNVFGYT
jgi:hypothetical protein